MSDIFLDVLNTSIAASWVVLAVVLARLLLKKAPRSLVCGLWGLVGLRLVFNGAIEAPFSLIPSTQTIPPESLYDTAPTIDSGVAIIDRVVNPVYTESFRADVTASVNPLQVWMAVFANIWVLGMVVMTVWAVISWLRVRRQVRESIPDGKGVFLCDRIDSPFIFGLFRPKIYLPSDLDEDAKVHVIAHERAHIARLDHWWKPLGFLLLTVNWFNPVLWLAYHLLCRDIEMACDERVVRKLGVDEKKAYSSALLSCSVTRRAIAACPLAFGEVGVKARVKSVLRYQKPAFWVILVTVLLTAVLAACLLTSPQSEPAEIRYNGILYVQEGAPVDFVPDKQQATDTLRSVLHDSTEHPQEDNQAVRLGWEYAGQPMYLVGNALYLEQPGGGSWLKFQMRMPHDFLVDDAWYFLTLRSGNLSSWEELTGGAAEMAGSLLHLLTEQQLEPGPKLDWSEYAEDSDARITIQSDRDGNTFELFRTGQYGWVCFLRSREYGDYDWFFDGSSLDSFLLPYETELVQAGGAFSVPGDAALSLEFRTVAADGIQLRSAIPSLEQDDSHIHWEWEALDDGIGFRCRPIGRKGWMNVYFFPQTETYSSSIHQTQEITFPNGTSGTLHYVQSPLIWEVAQLNTTEGQLCAEKTFVDDWTEQDHQTATAILGSITIHKGGVSLTARPNQLGIHLSVENVTQNCLTLICTQDGTYWNAIYTGRDYSLARWEEAENEWVFLPAREGTAWTLEAYTVPLGETTRTGINWTWIYGKLEPGVYRIYKNYSGERGMLADREEVSQSCYAEFTIE